MKLLNDSVPYSEIGKRFNISKQRVFQIAKAHKMGNRWDEGKKYRKNLHKEITKDIKANLSLEEITYKHSIDLNKLSWMFRLYFNTLIVSDFRKKRNNKILKDFVSGNTALNIVNDPHKTLNDPHRIRKENTIYGINTANGIRRFPKIGKRSLGGIFEDREVLKYITRKHDKSKLSFREIANELNKLGYKTITGKPFATQNTFVKYIAYKKNKNKKLNF